MLSRALGQAAARSLLALMPARHRTCSRLAPDAGRTPHMFSLGPAGHSHNRTVRHALFPLMTRITRLEFTAESGPGSRMQWNHQGSGHVHVTVDGADVVFQEAFTLDNGLPCQDRKCWHFGEEGIIFRHFREQRFQDILLLVPDAGGFAPVSPRRTSSHQAASTWSPRRPIPARQTATTAACRCTTIPWNCGCASPAHARTKTSGTAIGRIRADHRRRR